MARDISN